MSGGLHADSEGRHGGPGCKLAPKVTISGNLYSTSELAEPSTEDFRCEVAVTTLTIHSGHSA